MQVKFCRLYRRIPEDWLDCEIVNSGKPCEHLVMMCAEDAVKEVEYGARILLHA